MHQINTTTKKFTEAVTIDLGQLPVIDAKIDFILTDGTNPVIAENKTFAMTIGSVLGSLYKTDEDTVSFRYLKFNDDNIADSLVITMTMDGVEILNDVISLKYQRECVDKDALEEAINAKADKATTYTKTETDGLLDAKADVQTPVSYTTLNQSIKRFVLRNCKYSTEYNTQESASGIFYLYGDNPSPDNVVISQGETYDYPDLTIEYTLTESLTIKDTDSIDFLINLITYGDAETRAIARIYHGNDVIREGIYFYDNNSNSGSNYNCKTFSFENILKKGDFQYAIGDTLKIVILSRITNHNNYNLTLYLRNVRCYPGDSYLYINNTYLLWQKINKISEVINQYAPRPTYNMSYSTDSYNGSNNTIYLSNDYFKYNDPVNYSLGSDTTFDFGNVTNAGFLFKTGSDFTYTVVENSSYPMVVNKPIDFKPDKTYLIVIYYNMLFWTEVEDYGSSSSGN